MGRFAGGLVCWKNLVRDNAERRNAEILCELMTIMIGLVDKEDESTDEEPYRTDGCCVFYMCLVGRVKNKRIIMQGRLIPALLAAFSWWFAHPYFVLGGVQLPLPVLQWSYSTEGA